MKKTVVVGATPNPSRYAYLAAHRLKNFGHEIVLVGIKNGEVAGEPILDLRKKPSISNVDTVTMYIGPQNQEMWEEYILTLNPKRIVFNPGSENPNFAQKAQNQGVEVVNACTLVMLSANTF